MIYPRPKLWMPKYYIFTPGYIISGRAVYVQRIHTCPRGKLSCLRKFSVTPSTHTGKSRAFSGGSFLREWASGRLIVEHLHKLWCTSCPSREGVATGASQIIFEQIYLLLKFVYCLEQKKVVHLRVVLTHMVALFITTLSLMPGRASTCLVETVVVSERKSSLDHALAFPGSPELLIAGTPPPPVVGFGFKPGRPNLFSQCQTSELRNLALQNFIPTLCILFSTEIPNKKNVQTNMRHAFLAGTKV